MGLLESLLLPVARPNSKWGICGVGLRGESVLVLFDSQVSGEKMSKRQNGKLSSKPLKDQDYWNQLSDEEKDFLRRFNDNYYDGSFKKDGKDLITDQLEQEKLKEKDRAQKRDVYSPVRYHNPSDRAYHKLHDFNITVEPEVLFEERQGTYDSPEDALIEAIDINKKGEKK